TLAALGGEVFLVHASTAVFLALLLAGYLGARWLLARRDARAGLLAYAALLVPAAVALAWIAPIVSQTASHSPSSAELARSLARYSSQVHVHSLHAYALRPEVFARTGAIAVAALALVPLAFFAPRRRPVRGHVARRGRGRRRARGRGGRPSAQGGAWPARHGCGAALRAARRCARVPSLERGLRDRSERAHSRPPRGPSPRGAEAR